MINVQPLTSVRFQSGPSTTPFARRSEPGLVTRMMAGMASALIGFAPAVTDPTPSRQVVYRFNDWDEPLVVTYGPFKPQTSSAKGGKLSFLA